jgi:hypothetical protein
MLLRKLVDVEATSEDVRDYLRSLIVKSFQFRAGDVVRLPVGREGVVHLYASDGTVWVMYVDPGGSVRGQWFRLEQLELVERLPEHWQATELGEAAAASLLELERVTASDAERARREADRVKREVSPSAWGNLPKLGKSPER